MLVEMIETPSLGDRSYLVHDETVAIVIDPQRDTDRVTAAAEAAGVRVAAVAETHLHNDYVSGGYQLARELGVDYYVNAADNVAFDRRPVTDGEELIVGGLTVRVVATRDTPTPTCPTSSPMASRKPCSPAAVCCSGQSAARTSSAPKTPTP